MRIGAWSGSSLSRLGIRGPQPPQICCARTLVHRREATPGPQQNDASETHDVSIHFMDQLLNKYVRIVVLVMVCAITIALPADYSRAGAIRAWSPEYRTQLPPFDYLAMPELQNDSAGVPFMCLAGVDLDLSRSPGVGLQWQDSAWVSVWQLPTSIGRFSPILNDHTYRMWSGNDAVGGRGLYVSGLLPNAISSTEEIAQIQTPWAYWFSGAFSASRRWAVVDDNDRSRIFTARLGEPWAETFQFDWQVPSVAVLDDTTALVVHDSPPGWGKIEGARWIEGSGDLVIPGVGNEGPKLRQDPGGAVRVIWRAPQVIAMHRYQAGEWSEPRLLTCDYIGGSHNKFVGDFEQSHDSAQDPVVAWSFQDASSGSDGVCACLPQEGGYPPATQIMTGGRFFSIATTQDRNGDAWVAGWYYFAPLRWMHTYVTTTTSTPTASIESGRSIVRWSLSTASPKTWWAVLRSQSDGPFIEVARLEAGTDPAMFWIDDSISSMANEPVSYQIRRESVDKRFEWLSPSVRLDTPVSALPSLIDAQVGPRSVRLRWAATDATAAITVERLRQDEDWAEAGTPTLEGRSVLVFEDHDLTPGRYGYRLKWRSEQGALLRSIESWMVVPGRPLALTGAIPNPASTDLRVAFSLPDDAPARLEAWDVRGRLVASRDIGHLGEGEHTVALGEAGVWRTGLYFVRLVRGDEQRTVRAVVLGTP